VKLNVTGTKDSSVGDSPDGKMTLKTWAEQMQLTNKESQKYLRVQVHDTGMGIKPADQKNLFQLFGKLHQDNPNINPAGTGLGLSICKRIVEEFGGTISVHSQVSVGTRFTFTVPLEPLPVENTTENNQTEHDLNEEMKQEELNKKVKSHFFAVKKKDQFYSA